MTTRLQFVAALMLAVLARTAAGQEEPQAAKEPTAKAAKTTKAEKTPAPADEPQPPGPARGKYLEVIREGRSPPVLAIHYPWSVHLRPSVELRVLADDEADDSAIRPLAFVESYLKGDVTDAVYEARDRSWDLPHQKTLTVRGREIEVLGHRNRLGKPAVTVVFAAKAPPAETVPRAVFYLLDGWAFDRRTLRLELPDAHFAKPSRLRVWFFRDGDVVWSETVQWPGAK